MNEETSINCAIAGRYGRLLCYFSQNPPTMPLWKKEFFSCVGMNWSVLSLVKRMWWSYSGGMKRCQHSSHLALLENFVATFEIRRRKSFYGNPQWEISSIPMSFRLVLTWSLSLDGGKVGTKTNCPEKLKNCLERWSLSSYFKWFPCKIMEMLFWPCFIFVFIWQQEKRGRLSKEMYGKLGKKNEESFKMGKGSHALWPKAPREWLWKPSRLMLGNLALP